ncbi:TPA: his operon leader peptide [Yersinia enterocolitica]|nr:his operon leader peptide [Yersinia enterocolitica]
MNRVQFNHHHHHNPD